MKKIFIILILAITLLGCSKQISEQAIRNQIDKILVEKMPASNNIKNYFEYYLPYHVSKIDSDELNSVLKSNESEIILSVNPAEIIKNYTTIRTLTENITSFEKELTLFENLIVSVEGEYLENGRTINYSVHVNKYNEYKYLITMKVGYSKLTSVVFRANAIDIIRDMFIVGRSVKTNNQLIINDYRYQEQEVEANVGFNNTYYPNEGYLDENYMRPDEGQENDGQGFDENTEIE